jgi:hypothetical protein
MVRLTDEQMRDFIRNGYVAIKTGLSREENQDIWNQTEALFEEDGNPGNNLMARIPAIRQVLDDPKVDGALSGVLGNNYFIHPHRHCHYRPPHSEGQQIHRDSFTRRRHRTRWLLAMYYPQDTTVEMGPTGVLPGTHYFNWLVGPIGLNMRIDSTEGEVPVTVEAGTILMVHYDLWHRGMGNTTDKKRYMMKFMFARMEEPQEPSWDSQGGDWVAEDDNGLNGAWSHMWRWYSGQSNNGALSANGNGSIPELIANIKVDDEATCLASAYALGSIGESAIPALIDTFQHENEAVRRNASYALSSIGAAAVPALLDACKNDSEGARTMAVETLADLGFLGDEIMPTLQAALNDESIEVRRHAVDALGICLQNSANGVPALIDALGDEDEFMRRGAALALSRIGEKAQEATPALAHALNDENRYVRGKAVHALQRIGTSEANEALIHFLLTSQYCYSTTKDSLY